MVPTAHGECATETTGAAVWVTKLNVAHYFHKDVLLSINLINDPGTPLCDISSALAFYLLPSISA